MNRRGTLFVITGPSGAGKGTILREVIRSLDRLYFSVSATTRAPREGEVDGVHYHFLTKERFEQLIDEDKLLEHAQYVGNYYGTPLEPAVEHLENGEDVILEIELQGALQVKKRMPEAVLVFIAPPSFAELENRLRGRGTEKEETIQKRMETARKECAGMEYFRFIVVNDVGETAADELRAILLSHRCLRENRGFTME